MVSNINSCCSQRYSNRYAYIGSVDYLEMLTCRPCDLIFLSSGSDTYSDYDLWSYASDHWPACLSLIGSLEPWRTNENDGTYTLTEPLLQLMGKPAPASDW